MGAQPLNTAIQVFLTVRAQRQDHKHGNVESIIKKLNELVVVIPGQEILSGVLTRDTTFAGNTSPYMGEARFGAGRGFPIVVGLKDTISFRNAQENIATADFAFAIGKDAFIRTTAAGLTGDLFGDAGDLVAANN